MDRTVKGRKSTDTALLYSLIPGCGHLYSGDTIRGILWLSGFMSFASIWFMLAISNKSLAGAMANYWFFYFGLIVYGTMFKCSSQEAILAARKFNEHIGSMEYYARRSKAIKNRHRTIPLPFTARTLRGRVRKTGKYMN
jgi:hypothetical protein